METSPLARLSAELRNQIWTYALYQPDGVYLACPKGQSRLSCKGRWIALIKTCRQINTESSLLLYNINKFTFCFTGIGLLDCFPVSNPHANDWLRALGPTKASAIAELSFDVGGFSILPWPYDYGRWVTHDCNLLSNALTITRSLCKNLSALTLKTSVGLLLYDTRHQGTLHFEPSLMDQAEAIRQIEEVLDVELEEAMDRLNLALDEEKEFQDQYWTRERAAVEAEDDIADLEGCKHALLCAIKRCFN